MTRIDHVPMAAWRALRPVLQAVALVSALTAAPETWSQTATLGDPRVTVRRVEPEAGTWRVPGLLAVEVEIAHPAALRRDTRESWRMAPAGGWASALKLRVRDAAGNEQSWPFQSSAPDATQPLVLTPLMPAIAGYSLSPLITNVTVADGVYQLQAEVECTTGDGWRGRVVSSPVSLTARSPAANGLEVELEPVQDGNLVQGLPWGVRVALFYPPPPVPPSPRIAGGGREWLTNLTWSVRGPDGREVSWPWIAPDLAVSDESWINPGTRFPEAQYRLAATNTPAIPPGEYLVIARYARPAQGAGDLFWSGSIESKPLVVRVIARPPTTAANLEQRHRWQAEDALQEALSLRNRAGGVGVTTDQRLALSRQAAEPLVRAERAALQWLLLRGDSPGPALLLSRVYLAQEDKLSARGWADAAVRLEAAGRVSTPDEPVAPEDIPDPRLLAWRQFLDAHPEADRLQLLPTLRLAMDIQRGGPIPTQAAERDEFFIQDPRGQWAASARASSEYGTTSYSAMRATGPPDVRFAGDNVNAWATRFADTAGEWIELTFAHPVTASGVRVRQNFNPGAIAQLDLIDVDGGVSTVFSGLDTNVYAPATIGWFLAEFAPTAKPIARVRISLDSVRVRGWNEIDAVQLVAAPVIPLTAPRLVVLPPSPGSREITVADWPAGFRLERTASLEPPDWQPYADRPPAVIPLGAPAEFFRLSTAPP